MGKGRGDEDQEGEGCKVPVGNRGKCEVYGMLGHSGRVDRVIRRSGECIPVFAQSYMFDLFSLEVVLGLLRCSE